MSTEFCDFSLDHYREILESAKNSGYDFLLFDEVQTKATGRTCLLRHDIDYAPEKAMEFGQIEADLGIRSTYFFQVVAWTYNPRERICYQAIHKLKELGHQIALHFDVTWKENAQWDELPSLCDQERKLLAHLTGLDVPDIISFHNPGTYADRVVDKKVTGIHHTYEPRYFSEFKYLSDSQGWYEGCVCKLFESGKYPKIQLLTHPYIWWGEPGPDFIHDMAAFVNLRREQLTDYFATHHPVCTKNEEHFKTLVNNGKIAN